LTLAHRISYPEKQDRRTEGRTDGRTGKTRIATAA